MYEYIAIQKFILLCNKEKIYIMSFKFCYALIEHKLVGNVLWYYWKYISVPSTCTVTLALVELNSEFVPRHVYTPSFVGYWALTICRVDMIVPEITFPCWGCVKTSVWLNVLELLNTHLTVGVGPPTEVQLMLILFPSKTSTSWFTANMVAISV